MTKPIQITTNELLEELSRELAPDAPPGALTINEMAAKLRVSRTFVLNKLRGLREDGRLVEWRKRATDSKGRAIVSPAYTIITRRKGK